MPSRLEFPLLLRQATVPLILIVFMGGVLGGVLGGSRLQQAAPPPEPSLAAFDLALAPVSHHTLLPASRRAGPDVRKPTYEVAPPSKPKRAATRVEVRRGDTLFSILERAGIEQAEAHEAVTSLTQAFDPRDLQPGQALALELERARKGAPLRLVSLTMDMDFTNELKLTRDASGAFAAAQVPRELRTETRVARATINDSLYNTARRNDVPDATLLTILKLFSYDVDFQRDIQPGDGFEAVFETVSTIDGRERRTGELLYAAVNTRGHTFRAYRFEAEDGQVDYYDETGRSLRKWLMRTPIDGARLSSGFGKRRHPILGYTKMHKGTDFAAPTGTPIYAAGDGVVTYAGRKGAYGNYIRLRHSEEFSTAYAHLSKYKEGLRKGQRVKQGEVIGYVGTTGRSTGPHLHYEVLKNGEQINPLSLKPQTLTKLTGESLRRFRRQVETIEALIDRPRERQFAQNLP